MKQAYKNNQSLKQEIVSRMEEHIKLDQLIQRIGYDESSGKGCGIGCSINCYSHQSFADTLDVDLWIPQIYDNLHEGISVKHIAKFNLDFLNSIPVGMTEKHSDMVRLKLFYFILTEIIPSKFQKYKEIAAVIDLFKRSIGRITVTKQRWARVAQNIHSKYRFPTYASSHVLLYVPPYAYAYASAYSSAYAYAYAYTPLATYASAYAYASLSTYISAYVPPYAYTKEAMLKIGNKLIELFREVKV